MRKCGPGRPSRSRADCIDNDLLCAARAVFAERGISGASMDEVARVAGVTKQTIYRRYSSKAALIDAMVERDFSSFADAAAVPALSPLEALKMLALHQFNFCSEGENVAFLRFLIAEAAFSVPLRDKMEEWHERGSQMLDALIRDAQAAGLLRDGDTRVATRLLGDLIGAAGQALIWGAKDPFDGRTADAFFDERWSAFLAIWGVTERAAD